MPTLVRARTAAIYELLPVSCCQLQTEGSTASEKKKSKVKKGCHRVNEASREEIADFAALLAQASAPRPTYLLHASCGYGERKKLHLSDVFAANFPNDVNRSIACGAEQISSQNRISHCSQN